MVGDSQAQAKEKAKKRRHSEPLPHHVSTQEQFEVLEGCFLWNWTHVLAVSCANLRGDGTWVITVLKEGEVTWKQNILGSHT
jgi:hypothetical protein